MLGIDKLWKLKLKYLKEGWTSNSLNKNIKMMRTIIKNEDGTFWVRWCGMYVGTFATYEEAKKS